MLEKLSFVMVIASVVIGYVYGIFIGFIALGVYGLLLSAIDTPDQGE